MDAAAKKTATLEKMRLGRLDYLAKPAEERARLRKERKEGKAQRAANRTAAAANRTAAKQQRVQQRESVRNEREQKAFVRQSQKNALQMARDEARQPGSVLNRILMRQAAKIESLGSDRKTLAQRGALRRNYMKLRLATDGKSGGEVELRNLLGGKKTERSSEAFKQLFRIVKGGRY